MTNDDQLPNKARHHYLVPLRVTRRMRANVIIMMMRILAVAEIALAATLFAVSAVFAVVFAVQERAKHGKLIAENSHSTALPLICVGSAVLAAVALILMIRKRTKDR